MIYLDSAGFAEFMKADDEDNGKALKSPGLAKVRGGEMTFRVLIIGGKLAPGAGRGCVFGKRGDATASRAGSRSVTRRPGHLAWRMTPSAFAQ
jgi:hypothetical protein